jgi:flagellar basal body-associated protein FliL
MVKKAKLDILDIEIDEKGEAPVAEDMPLKDAQDGHGEEGKTGDSFFDRIKSWAKKPLFWIIMVAVPLTVIITSIIFWIFYESAILVSAKKTTITTVAPVTTKMGNMVLFEGFVIDLEDEKSNTRIVLCDIAIELKGTRDISAIENPADARNALYMLLKKRKPQDLLVSEARNRLKEDFKNELNRFFGEDIVKNVYFSRVEAM